jgi:hypothetical protein
MTVEKYTEKGAETEERGRLHPSGAPIMYGDIAMALTRCICCGRGTLEHYEKRGASHGRGSLVTAGAEGGRQAAP